MNACDPTHDSPGEAFGVDVGSVSSFIGGHREIMRRRYPPDGDMERWVREGPPGHVNYTGGPVAW